MPDFDTRKPREPNEPNKLRIPAFLSLVPAVLAVWTGVMHFPRKVSLLEVRAGLGVVASCL